MRNLVLLQRAHSRSIASRYSRPRLSSSRPKRTCACRWTQTLRRHLSLLNALTSSLVGPQPAYLDLGLVRDSRLSLYRDFDLMDIDSNGVWTNENDSTAIDIALRHAQSAPAFSLTIPARIPDLSPGVAFRQHVLHRRRARRQTKPASRRRQSTPLKTSSPRLPLGLEEAQPGLIDPLALSPPRLQERPARSPRPARLRRPAAGLLECWAWPEAWPFWAGWPISVRSFHGREERAVMGRCFRTCAGQR